MVHYQISLETTLSTALFVPPSLSSPILVIMTSSHQYRSSKVDNTSASTVWIIASFGGAMGALIGGTFALLKMHVDAKQKNLSWQYNLLQTLGFLAGGSAAGIIIGVLIDKLFL